MQECLGRVCVRGQAVSAYPEQARHQAAAGLHRQQRAMDRSPPRRIAGGTRADPLIGPRGTEGVGAHPVSPVRGRSIGSSTGIHVSACGRMNGGSRDWASNDFRRQAPKPALSLGQALKEAKESAPKVPQGRPAARSDAGAASMSEDVASRRRCETKMNLSREDEPVEAGSKHTRMAGVCGLEPQALGFGDRCSTN